MNQYPNRTCSLSLPTHRLNFYRMGSNNEFNAVSIYSPEVSLAYLLNIMPGHPLSLFFSRSCYCSSCSINRPQAYWKSQFCDIFKSLILRWICSHVSPLIYCILFAWDKLLLNLNKPSRGLIRPFCITERSRMTSINSSNSPKISLKSFSLWWVTLFTWHSFRWGSCTMTYNDIQCLSEPVSYYNIMYYLVLW